MSSDRSWVRAGGPRGLGLLLLVLSPLLWAGPIRTVLTTRIWASFWVATAGLGAVALIGRRRLWKAGTRWDVTVWALASAAIAVFVLFNRDFGGLVNYVGGDGGVHVYYRGEFVRSDPKVYAGCVSLYGFAWLFERIFHCSVFWSFCAAFYLVVSMVAIAPIVVVGFSLSPELAATTRRNALAITFFVQQIALLLVCLPLLHYAQEDGFYSHLFGIVPLVLVWIADVALESRLPRLFAVLAFAALLRFTYGLNLVDLLLAVAAIVLLEAPGLRKRWWLPLLGLAAVLSYGAWRVYQEVSSMIGLWGWYVGYDAIQAEEVEMLSVIALFALAAALRRAELGWRLLRFPLLFCLINGVAFAHFRRAPGREAYYLLKYNLYSVILFFLAAAAALGVATARMSFTRSRRAVSGLLAALVCLGIITDRWYDVFAVYQPHYRERVFGPPYKELLPQADLGAWVRIDRALKDEEKKFGGYITAPFPMFNFMNAAFGYYNRGRKFWERGQPNTSEGHCVFWETPYFADDAGTHLSKTRDLLHREADKKCVSYKSHWNPSGPPRTLCYKCY